MLRTTPTEIPIRSPIDKSGLTSPPRALSGARRLGLAYLVPWAFLAGGCILGSAEVGSLDLTVSLRVEPARLSPGQQARAILTVTNSGVQVARLVFPTVQRYDFVLLDLHGSELWRWSAGRMFAQLITSDSLAAGASVVYEESFTLPGAAGQYRLIGSLLLMDGVLSDTVALNVAELR